MDGRHPVSGPGRQAAVLVVDEVAQHVEVTFLRGQVDGGHVVVHATVWAERQERERKVITCCLYILG
jgi:hypothetical protein